MNNFEIKFPEINFEFPMIFVEGTNGNPYQFGDGTDIQSIDISDFFISRFPITQNVWEQIMGNNPAQLKNENHPAEGISYRDIVFENGFLAKLNAFDSTRGKFRLPTESEWEYAAKGGRNWRDNFTHSGSNVIGEVGWYQGNSDDKTHPVGQKKPNQLGIYDLNGNVWEWCADYFQRDTNLIPKDGSPCQIESNDRVLRGGCHHNGAVHCTVSNRYEIPPAYKDGCIGFRLAVSIL